MSDNIMDWITVSALVFAALTFLGYDKLCGLLQQAIARTMRSLHLKPASCETVLWEDLPDRLTLHQCPLPYENCVLADPKSSSEFSSFLSYFNALRSVPPRRSDKPIYLDLSREYFCTDAKTVLLCFMASLNFRCRVEWTYCKGANWIEFRYGQSIIRLTERGELYEGKINIRCSGCALVKRRTMLEYEQILIHGYPPWYKEVATNCAGLTFPFPSLDNGNINRGGWILAVGLGDINDPLPYFLEGFGGFRKLGWHHHRGGCGTYRKSCNHLQRTIETEFKKLFPGDKVVRAAIKAIKGMMTDHSASGVTGFLRGTVLADADMSGKWTDQLDKSQIELALEIFNGRNKVDAVGRHRLEPILRAVLAGAIRGLARVLAHLNDTSFQVGKDFEEQMARNPKVYCYL